MYQRSQKRVIDDMIHDFEKREAQTKETHEIRIKKLQRYHTDKMKEYKTKVEEIDMKNAQSTNKFETKVGWLDS